MTYEVEAKMITYLTATVEADNIDEAYDIALNMDGSEYHEELDDRGWPVGDWDIIRIFNEEEEEWYQ